MKTCFMAGVLVAAGLLASCASTPSISAERRAEINQAVDELSAKTAAKLSDVSTADASQCYSSSLSMQMLMQLADSQSAKTKFGGVFVTKVWKSVVDSRPESERLEATELNKARREALKVSEAGLSSEERLTAMATRMADCSDQVATAIKEVNEDEKMMDAATEVYS